MLKGYNICYNITTESTDFVINISIIIWGAKVLQMEPSNLKALFKRGIAYTFLSDFDNAKADLDSVCNCFATAMNRDNF